MGGGRLFLVPVQTILRPLSMEASPQARRSPQRGVGCRSVEERESIARDRVAGSDLEGPRNFLLTGGRFDTVLELREGA